MRKKHAHHQNDCEGLTLVELLIVLSIFAILAALVAIGPGVTSTERVRGVAKELLADLQWIRYSAMTQGRDASSPQLLGFGVRFESKNRYRLFRFNDANGNFAYDGVEEEQALSSAEARARPREITPPIELKIKKGGTLADPEDVVLLFDHYGIPRQSNFGFQQMSIVFHHPEMHELQKKCVSVSFNRIREGVWNENECQEQ